MRVARLRKRIIDAPREVCVERAQFFTQAVKEHWDKPAATRMSLGLERVLENITPVIHEDELIVGARTKKLKGAPIFPENKVRWLETDVDTFNDRVLQRVLIETHEQDIIRNEIIPFWKGRTAEERLEELMPPDVLEDMDKYIFTMILEITYGLGHFTMDHETLLGIGLAGIISRAQGKFDALSADEQQGEKGIFYDAVIRSLKAAIRFANRYADHADELAEKADAPQRAAELYEIAAVCRRVPEHPAHTFREAVQSVYFVHLMSQIESGGNSISLGRIDQFLYPYYKADLDAGRTTPDAARELLSLMYLKTNEIWNILEEAFIPGGEGTEGKTTQNVTLGGMAPDGRDATNELSYVALDAFADVCTVQPNLSVRISPGAPEAFFLRACEHARAGAPLHLFNDDTVVASLQQAGHSLEDARNYGVVGCVEPNAQGKTFASTFAVQFNAIKCLELALSNGIDNIFGFQAGIESGDPLEFTTMDHVWDAYKKQVSHFMNQMARGMSVLDQTLAELVPSPLASAMIQGPLDKGLDLTQGGAVYNSTGVQFIGFANTVDSLYAIQKTVFEDQSETIEDLCEYLSQDWDDNEAKRAYFLHKLPKYGTDHDGVDTVAAQLLNYLCDEVSVHKNYRGGAFWPGVFSVGFHIAMGSFTGASADGRNAGDVLGNGATPTNGNALQGPTAVINTITKLPLKRVFNGVNLNMRFNQGTLRHETLKSLMSTYFRKGGYQAQFNMADTATLRRAQEDPDSHRDLVVRVSGYSALFTGLSELAQAEIIARTEYEA
jgi:formate C-acetyltransferase